MSACGEDLERARGLAEQIVATGEGRVRRVVMIGSRALGTARPESDLDLVVLVELAAGAKPWGVTDSRAARARIQKQVPQPPIRTELWVRTVDQYEEARRIECSIEWRVEAEGVEVYARAVDRPAVARRPLAAVRREYVFGWISHALQALDAAVAMENGAALRNAAPEAARPAHAAVMRAVTALLVVHRIHASKHDGLETMLTRLSVPAPAAVAAIRSHLSGRSWSARRAHAAVQEVVHRLARDKELAPLLAAARRHLSQPLVFLAG
ncbi:MAG TPA: nucleotidyltransferase domain-containing protein [Longimicrobium sp.]